MANSLVLVSGRVHTMDRGCPWAEAVAVRGGRVVAVGSNDAARRAAAADAAIIDCRGRVVVPGFVDPHIHLAAYAAALRAVDCSPAHVRSVEDIVRLIRARADELPPGVWVRAGGYDETALAEGRHPSRWDLDAAAPDHPVRLLHRSGHAAVLNSRALALAGIDVATEEPPGGAIDRRLNDGEPTGLLLEMNDLIARAVPPLPRAELVAGMREAGVRLLAAGITAVQDMSHSNGPDAWRFLGDLAAESGFRPRLLPPALGWDAARDGQAGEVGRPVKLMPREVGERPVPDSDEMEHAIRACAAQGRQVAIHAVRRQTLEAAVAAFERAGAATRTAELRHRIEHAAQCPPPLVERVAALGLVVVANPSFLHHSRARYRRQIPAEELPYLYPLGDMHAAGVMLAAGSDAPVAPPDPPVGIRAAVERGTFPSPGGHAGPGLDEAPPLPGTPLPPAAALALHATGAAFAAHAERAHGRIAPGRPADLVVLSAEPWEGDVRVVMTIVGGQAHAAGNLQGS